MILGVMLICFVVSLPPRGAWIEINQIVAGEYPERQSLPPRGAWIEIKDMKSSRPFWSSRSPRGERGLKS